jgi:hypothetical protein
VNDQQLFVVVLALAAVSLGIALAALFIRRAG